MSSSFKGLRAFFTAAEDSADFGMSISACDPKGTPLYSAGYVKLDDPELGAKLRLICQAYRAGQNTADKV